MAGVYRDSGGLQVVTHIGIGLGGAISLELLRDPGRHGVGVDQRSEAKAAQLMKVMGGQDRPRVITRLTRRSSLGGCRSVTDDILA